MLILKSDFICMGNKEGKPVIKGTWEEVIKASVKGNPKPKPKKKAAKKK